MTEQVEKTTGRGSPKGGRPTKEQAKENFEKDRAERAAVNKAMRQAHVNKMRAKAQSGSMYKDKNTAEKIELAMSQILTQFIDEIKGKPLIEITNYSHRETVQQRKDQLSIIKETMATIRQLRELKDVLKDDEAAGKKENPMSADNLVLIDSARDLLKQKGVKAEL